MIVRGFELKNIVGDITKIKGHTNIMKLKHIFSLAAAVISMAFIYGAILFVKISPINDAPGNLMELVVGCEAGKHGYRSNAWPFESLANCIYRELKRENIFEIEYVKNKDGGYIGAITPYSEFTMYFGCASPLFFMTKSPEDINHCKSAYRDALVWLLKNDDEQALAEAFKYHAGECNVFHVALDYDDPALFGDLLNAGGNPFRKEINYCTYFNHQQNIDSDDRRSPGEMLVDGVIKHGDKRWMIIVESLKNQEA